MSFIGIANNIWRDTNGVSQGTHVPSWVLLADGVAAAIDFDFANQRAWVNGAAGTPDSFLTCTRAGTTANVLGSNGSWAAASANTIRYQYDPTSLLNLGAYVEEARTNSIRNNSMQGVVVGTARTVGTITSLTRTASATAVALSATTNVAVNDQVTITGASVAEYNGTYLVTAASPGVSFSYITASVQTDAATGATGTAISPGTIPTNWTKSTSVVGISIAITTTGIENGIEYFDVRISGIPTGSGAQSIFFPEAPTQIVASNTQTWASSAFVSLQAGSATNINSIGYRLRFNDSGGTLLTSQDTSLLGASSGNLRQKQFTNIFTAANASTAAVMSQLVINVTSGNAIDITLRFGWPQLELGASVTSPIRTTTVAVARNSDVILMTLPTYLQSMTAMTYMGAGIPSCPAAYNLNQAIAQLDNGTDAERLVLRRNLTTAAVLSSWVTSGSTGANPNPSATWTQNTAGKIGVTGVAGSSIPAFNGTLGTGGAITPLPPSLTTLRVGKEASSAFWNGTVSRISLWPTKISNSSLQTITT